MIAPAVMRAVGVKEEGRRWFGAIAVAHGDGYAWVCRHHHLSRTQARGCAEAHLDAYLRQQGPPLGWTYRI